MLLWHWEGATEPTSAVPAAVVMLFTHGTPQDNVQGAGFRQGQRQAKVPGVGMILMRAGAHPSEI